MNKLYTILLTMLLALTGSVRAWADSDEFSGKILSLGNLATSLETGKWYFLSNNGTGRFVCEGKDNTLSMTSTSPSGLDAADALGYLVQLESTGAEGKYYLKTAMGHYFSTVNTKTNKGTIDAPTSSSAYTIASFSNVAGHWSFRSNGMYYMKHDNGTLNGAAAIGSVGGDRDWALREVVFQNVSDLTGNAYIKYVLNKGGLVRLTNRRLSNANLAQIGSVMQGTPAQNNDLAQVWILSKSGDGYNLRNASTGAYLDSENNFRSPNASAVKLYIQSSPNNTATSSYINLSTKADFAGNECLNLNGDGTSLYKWACKGDHGSDWSITVVDNFSLDEVLAGLLANSKYKAPQEGKYYRIQNLNYKTYINEGITSNGLGCEGLNEDKLAQYWTLVKIGSGFALQNVCTQRYVVRQGGARSRQYTTQEAKPGQGFTCKRTADDTNFTYYIVDNGGVGLHCDQGSNVVGWDTEGLSTSTWGFEEVELTD